ncbi:MAG: hypothetical protein IJ493_12065 [Clostridia bacterium]|nr:hypothetical protein [Clostridia bacterium]
MKTAIVTAAARKNKMSSMNATMVMAVDEILPSGSFVTSPVTAALS